MTNMASNSVVRLPSLELFNNYSLHRMYEIKTSILQRKELFGAVQVLCVDGVGTVRPPHQPQSPFTCSLDDGLSITGSDFVSGILMALCGTLLRIYWLLYMSITSQTTHPPRPMVMSHLVTPFLLGSSRVQNGGLDPVQVHQTAPRTFIS